MANLPKPEVWRQANLRPWRRRHGSGEVKKAAFDAAIQIKWNEFYSWVVISCRPALLLVLTVGLLLDYPQSALAAAGGRYHAVQTSWAVRTSWHQRAAAPDPAVR